MTDFFVAWSTSSGLSSTVTVLRTAPAAHTVMLTAAAETLSGNSRIVYTSSSPKAK